MRAQLDVKEMPIARPISLSALIVVLSLGLALINGAAATTMMIVVMYPIHLIVMRLVWEPIFVLNA